MFESFPKTRPPLPRAIQDIYSEYYRSNREGQTIASSLAQRTESWLHRQVAHDVANLQNSSKVTLELGAGTLNQLQYESAVNVYDVVEPLTDLYKGSPFHGRVRNFYRDISEVPSSHRYDRITSIATLEHVCNLPEVVARIGILLADDGSFRASIPSEGTFLWTLGWRLTTGLEFRLKYGLDYGLFLEYEHVNTAKEIESVLEYFFRDIKCKVFGLSKSVSLYQFYACRGPHVDECLAFLQTAGA